MEAYGDHMLVLANARLDDLRRESAQRALARSLGDRQPRRWRRVRTRQQAVTAVPLPTRAEPASGDLRRSA